MESFFGTLKSKFFYLNPFQNLNELEAGLVHYIHDYNHGRITLKLKWLSPVLYRTQPSQPWPYKPSNPTGSAQLVGPFA
jgi:putative transposase